MKPVSILHALITYYIVGTVEFVKLLSVTGTLPFDPLGFESYCVIMNIGGACMWPGRVV